VLVIHTTFGVEVRYSNYTDLEWSLRVTGLSAGGTCTEENIVIQKSLSSKQRQHLGEIQVFQTCCSLYDNSCLARGEQLVRGSETSSRVRCVPSGAV